MICIFLCVPFLIKAQNRNAIVSKADSLFRLRQYDEAMLGYEQAFFELSEWPDSTLSKKQIQDMKNAFLLKKLYCQKAAQKFTMALQTSQRFDFSNLEDQEQIPLRYETVVCSFLAGLYDDCFNNVQQFKHFVKDSTQHTPTLLWEILSLTQLARYDEAKALIPTYNQAFHTQINAEELFAFAQKTKFRSIRKAEALATFVPGAGMIYAGNTTQGIVSLVLQLGTLGYGAYSIINGYYFTGIFTGLGLFQAFYFGGVRRSAYLAEQKNMNLKNQYYQQVKKGLLSNRK